MLKYAPLVAVAALLGLAFGVYSTMGTKIVYHQIAPATVFETEGHWASEAPASTVRQQEEVRVTFVDPSMVKGIDCNDPEFHFDRVVRALSIEVIAVDSVSSGHYWGLICDDSTDPSRRQLTFRHKDNKIWKGEKGGGTGYGEGTILQSIRGNRMGNTCGYPSTDDPDMEDCKVWGLVRS